MSAARSYGRPDPEDVARRVQRRVDALRVFLALNTPRAFTGAARPDTDGPAAILVAPCPRDAGKWRVSRVMPSGDVYHGGSYPYAFAVEIADVTYGVVLADVEFFEP